MRNFLSKSFLALGFLGLIGLANAPALHAQETRVIRLGHPNGLVHHMGRTLTKMAEDVRAGTAGRISIEQERAGPETALTSVKDGKLDAAGIATFYWTTQGAVGGLEQAIPEMDLLMIPYQLTDIEKLKRFPTSPLAKQMENRVTAAGVHPLMWIFITNTAIITSMNKPILEPSDLKGLRMRSLRGLNETMFKLAGATPTPMPPSAFGKWVADGNGDGGTTDVYAAASGKWAETQKFGTIAPLYSVFYLIFVNQKTWDSISPADQRTIENAARAAEQSDFDLAEQADKDAIEKLRAGGMTLHIQTPEERKHWQAAFVEPLTKVFLQQVSDGQKLLNFTNGR
jgi:TRAP-type C4-dicarboxylate transport system substrate-binding protein